MKDETEILESLFEHVKHMHEKMLQKECKIYLKQQPETKGNSYYALDLQLHYGKLGGATDYQKAGVILPLIFNPPSENDQLVSTGGFLGSDGSAPPIPAPEFPGHSRRCQTLPSPGGRVPFQKFAALMQRHGMGTNGVNISQALDGQGHQALVGGHVNSPLDEERMGFHQT